MFEAAKRGRLLNDWVSSGRDANAELQGAVKILRDRARDLERNNEWVEAYLDGLEENVVGVEGFSLVPRVAGIGGRTDEVAARAIKHHWREWCNSEYYLVDGSMTAAEADMMAMRTLARDGELPMKLVRGEGRYGLSLQFLEGDFLDETFHQAQPDGYVVMGVELSPLGRPRAYHVFESHPGAWLSGPLSVDRTRRVRVPAEDFLLVFQRKRPLQVRGYSFLAPVMKRLKLLAGYEEAELVAARVAAAKMGFFYREGDGKWKGESVAPGEGEAKGDAGAYMEAEPGVFDQLDDGLKFAPWDPQHPTSQFPSFLKSLLRGIASGLRVSYNGLANDLEGVNYSSLREGKLTEREFFKRLQLLLVQQYKLPVFRAWLEEALLRGAIVDPVTGIRLEAERLEAYRSAAFRARRWPWVDPLKDLKAKVLERENNWKSDSAIVQEMGGELETVYMEIDEDGVLAEKYGVEKTVASPQGQPPADEDEEEEEEEEAKKKSPEGE